MTLKYIWRSFRLGCHFHVHFSYPWHAFASHGLSAIAELLVFLRRPILVSYKSARASSGDERLSRKLEIQPADNKNYSKVYSTTQHCDDNSRERCRQLLSGGSCLWMIKNVGLWWRSTGDDIHYNVSWWHSRCAFFWRVPLGTSLQTV